MTATFQLNGDRLVDRVVELLRDRIIEARYAPGEPLPRRRLAEELNLGATVVGEALRVLRREGLVYRGRRGEMRVAWHDRSLLLDAFELRCVIDGLAARLAAGHGASPGVALEKALAEQRTAIAIGDTRRFCWADIAFHRALLDCSGNVLLRSCVSIVRWTSRNASWDGREMRLELSEHEAILQAVRARDAREAERAAQAHVRQWIDDAGRETRSSAGAPVDNGRASGR
jgi:DNA-binding GntR family transcriptional regulator